MKISRRDTLKMAGMAAAAAVTENNTGIAIGIINN